MSQIIWNRVKEDIKSNLNKTVYTNWIEPLVYLGLQDNKVIFSVPAPFYGSYVSQQFGDMIIHQFLRHGVKVHRVDFEIAAKTNIQDKMPGNRTHMKDHPLSNASVKSRENPTKLDHRYTFDTFVAGKSNEVALAVAQRVANDGRMEPNILTFNGKSGVGKTHLLHAIAWQLSQTKPDLKTVFLPAEQFMNRFIRALQDQKTMDFKDACREPDVLIIDDVQFLAGKKGTQEELLHTFNALYEQKKQIIFAVNKPPGDLDGIKQCLRSRMQGGLVLDLGPADADLRRATLKKWIEIHGGDYHDTTLSKEIQEFLVVNVPNGLRELHGAMMRNYTIASMRREPLTLEMVKDWLSDDLRSASQHIRIADVQSKVSAYYEISVADLTGPNRKRMFVRPRQMAMYICKKLTQRSLPDIGRRFGGRDHTTVMHAIRKIEELRKVDKMIANDYETISRDLLG